MHLPRCSHCYSSYGHKKGGAHTGNTSIGEVMRCPHGMDTPLSIVVSCVQALNRALMPIFSILVMVISANPMQARALTWTNRKSYKHLEHIKDCVTKTCNIFCCCIAIYCNGNTMCLICSHAVLLAVSWLAHDLAPCELFLQWPTTNGTKGVHMWELMCIHDWGVDTTWLTACEMTDYWGLVITAVHWAEARIEGSIWMMMVTKKRSHKMARN